MKTWKTIIHEIQQKLLFFIFLGLFSTQQHTEINPTSWVWEGKM